MIMQETQSIGHVSAIVFSLSNSVRRRENDTVNVTQRMEDNSQSFTEAHMIICDPGAQKQS